MCDSRCTGAESPPSAFQCECGGLIHNLRGISGVKKICESTRGARECFVFISMLTRRSSHSVSPSRGGAHYSPGHYSLAIASLLKLLGKQIHTYLCPTHLGKRIVETDTASENLVFSRLDLNISTK